MNALSLFSGCGGFDLAAERAGVKIVAQCEIDENCRAILRNHWPAMTIYEDVRTLEPTELTRRHGSIDLIFGGPPCQPVSVAGRREAAGDSRNMWPEYLRLLRELKPRWAVAENPTGVLSAPRVKGDPKGTFFGDILREMDAMGCVVGWGVWGACDVAHDEGGAPLPIESAGCAPHQRERVFIVAHRDGERESQPDRRFAESWGRACYGGDVADGEKQWSDGEMQTRRGRTGLTDRRDVGHTFGCAPRDDLQHGWPGAGEDNALRAASGDVGDAELGGSHGLNRRWTGSELTDGHLYQRSGSECRLGRSAHGPARWLDVIRWPAGRGAEQFTWEPPRVVPGGKRGRGARLKMLGNMVVPQQAVILFQELMNFEEA